LSITGERALFVITADSGAKMQRSFCPKCGTPLFSEAQPRPHLVIVRVGSLDDPSVGRPMATIWTKSAPAWACFDEGLPKAEREAPPAA
jgi:hypothetical protein